MGGKPHWKQSAVRGEWEQVSAEAVVGRFTNSPCGPTPCPEGGEGGSQQPAETTPGAGLVHRSWALHVQEAAGFSKARLFSRHVNVLLPRRDARGRGTARTRVG